VQLDQRAVPIAQAQEQRVLAIGLEQQAQEARVLDLVLILNLVLVPFHQPIGNDE